MAPYGLEIDKPTPLLLLCYENMEYFCENLNFKHLSVRIYAQRY